MGCRIINSPRERLIAIITNTFVPCNGRFPLLITMSSIFIGGLFINNSGALVAVLFVLGIIVFGVLMTLFVSWILSKTILKGVQSSFTLELPPYRKPQIAKTLVRSLLDRTLHVLARAVTVAVPAGAIIWFMANTYIGNLSILAHSAAFLDPFARLMGLDGYILMAFLLGLPANEIVLPIIIMSYMGGSTMMEIEQLSSLRQLLTEHGWTILTSVNVMLFSLLHFPCATTIITIKKETNSLKWTVISFLVPTFAGIIICITTTQLWRLFM